MTINIFLQMDQEWKYVGNRVSQRFIEGLETFFGDCCRIQEARKQV
jgi:hypothetical protein